MGPAGDFDLSPARRAVLLAAVAAVAIAVRLPLLHGSFIAVDDYSQIIRNPVITQLTWEHLKQVSLTNFMHRGHAPMYVSFMLNWAATPGSYAGFAAVNLAFLPLLVVAFYHFCGLFVRGHAFRIAATALFSVHAVTADIVAWMSARCHLFGVTFLLLSLAAWKAYLDAPGARRKTAWYAASLLAAGLAVWNKNLFCTVGLLIIAYDAYRRRRVGLAAVIDKLPFLAIGACAIAALQANPYMTDVSTPAMGGSIAVTLMNDANLLVEYLQRLLVPGPTYVWVDVYPATGLLDVSRGSGLAAMRLAPLASVGILAAVAGFLAWLLWRARLEEPLVAAACGAIALAPVMNIPPRWVEFAFRYDLVPAAFFCAALAAAAAHVWKRSGPARIAVVVVFAALTAWHAGRTCVQSMAWRTPLALNEACARAFPDAKPCLHQEAEIYAAQGRSRDAIRVFERVERLVDQRGSLRIGNSAFRLGQLYMQAGDTTRACRYFERSLLRGLMTPSWRDEARRMLAGKACGDALP
jgi:hypothetical protein